MIGYGLGHNNFDIVSRYMGDIYFESAGTILTLITLGKFLETRSKGKTSDAISKLVNLAPKTAIVLRDGKEVLVNTEEIIYHDIVVIKPGGSIPVDGIVLEGTSTVDQSSITGESIPVEKKLGDTVVSGTVNKNGILKIRATKVGENTTLSQIIKLVEEASNSKAPISKMADRVSGVFVPVVITIAILATLYWIFIAHMSFEFALSVGIAVLVISCPCALGLATPVAIMVGTGKGAQNGVLIKSAESLELLHNINTVVFDKTGTITEGKPKVTDIISYIDEKELLKIAGSLEQNSEHPLADAIMSRVKEENIDVYNIDSFNSTSGRGIEGKINTIRYIGGNISFMEENNIKGINIALNDSQSMQEQGKTCIYFADTSKIIGIIGIADTIKKTSAFAIEELQKRNIDTIMITGDNKKAANAIASETGIVKVISEVLPQDKEIEVAKLQKEGKRVAFVGDGINDSPALVKADVGLAIGSGTDIAIESADIVLIKNDLLDVVSAIDLSKAVINNIKMNLFWAFFYNAIGIPIAAGAFYLSFGLKLNPMIGALAMSFSSVCVVTNALRLKNFKPKFIKRLKKDNLIDEYVLKKDINVNKIRKNLYEVSNNIEKNDNKDKEKVENNENINNNINIENNTNESEDKKENMFTKEISIEGMSCNHCKMSVEKALGNIDDINEVKVSLENKNAIIKSSIEIDDNKIIEAIEEEGFKVIDIK